MQREMRVLIPIEGYNAMLMKCDASRREYAQKKMVSSAILRAGRKLLGHASIHNEIYTAVAIRKLRASTQIHTRGRDLPLMARP